MPHDKTALRDALVALLQRELDALESAHRAVMEAATHEEARPENDKDTRALEQSYLARGQALRVEALRAAVAETRAMPVGARDPSRPIGVGALVTLTDDDGARVLLVAPHGGGNTLEGGVQVVTPGSPLGRAVLGKALGDICEAISAGKSREYEVTDVR